MTPRRLSVGLTPGALSRVLADLSLPAVTTTLVVNGGTSDESEFPTKALTAALAVAVTEVGRRPGPVIVSGGTRAGLFALLGEALDDGRFVGPVIGVVPVGEVTRPDATPLEPHHTHALLVGGRTWGEETPTMLELCAELDGRGPVVVVLAGGGRVARLELDGHRRARRAVVVLAGTGRLADQVGAPDSGVTGVRSVPVDDPAALRRTLAEILGAADGD